MSRRTSSEKGPRVTVEFGAGTVRALADSLAELGIGRPLLVSDHGVAALGGLSDLQLHHGTLNALLMPALVRFNAAHVAGLAGARRDDVRAAARRRARAGGSQSHHQSARRDRRGLSPPARGGDGLSLVAWQKLDGKRRVHTPERPRRTADGRRNRDNRGFASAG